MSRGNHRGVLFRDEEDYLEFLRIIKWVKEDYNYILHSICMMSNHFHMEIETSDIELSRIMQKILSFYSKYFNKKYDLTGHLFESRYTACIIENEAYFLEVSRYIHLNPVKAQIVINPINYKYSSYGLYALSSRGMGLKWKIMEELIDTTRILAMFPKKSKEAYKIFVEINSFHDHENQIQKDIREDDYWMPK